MNSRPRVQLPPVELRRCSTERVAVALAERCGCPNVRCGAEYDLTDRCWIPVIYLRPDQEWMRSHVEERGVVARGEQS